MKRAVLLGMALWSGSLWAVESAQTKQYYPKTSPTYAIQKLDDTLEVYITNPKTREEKKFNEFLKRFVLKGTFDIQELSKLALDAHWAKLSPEQQNHFVAVMTSLLEKKAIFSKEQSEKRTIAKTRGEKKNAYYVRYLGDKSAANGALVKTLVVIPSEDLNVELNYKMRKPAEVWKIYDVVVDGASLLANYKYQFNKIITNHGYEDLMRRMEGKLNKLEEKEDSV